MAFVEAGVLFSVLYVPELSGYVVNGALSVSEHGSGPLPGVLNYFCSL